METLLNEEVNVVEWCDKLIAEQSAVKYDSLTSVRDFNHVIKSHVQQIMDYIKHNFETMSEETGSRLQQALQKLLVHLKNNDVWTPDKHVASLDKDDLENEFKKLYVVQTSRVDRKYKDPAIRNQHYGLYSFKPSAGARPDHDGNYGVLKLRGNFEREDEAEEKARELVQYFSANRVFVCEVGRPVFIKEKNLDLDYIVEVDDPDNDKDAVKYADLIKEQSLKDKKKMEEIKSREEELKRDVAMDPSDKDPLDHYIELNKKRSTVTFHYKTFQKKLDELKELIVKARKEIADMDAEHPDYKTKYVEYYEEKVAGTGVEKSTDDMAMMIKECFKNDPDLGF